MLGTLVKESLKTWPPLAWIRANPGKTLLAAIVLTAVLIELAPGSKLVFPGRYSIESSSRLTTLKIDRWTGETWHFDLREQVWRPVKHGPVKSRP